MAGRLPALLSGLADRLAVRILLLLSLALLPLGLIAVHTTAEALRTAHQGSERALIGLTADSVAGKRALIESALASGRALGPLTIERLDDPEACRALLADYVDRSGVFGFAGFIERDGWMRCASTGETFDFSDRAVFQELRDRPRTLITATASGAATGVPEVIVTQPVYSQTALVGFLSVSISQRSVQLMGRVTMEEAPRHVVLFNHEGALISVDPAIGENARTHLPRDVLLAGLVGGGSSVFHGTAGDGSRATFVVAEILPRRLYALGTWPEASAGPTGWRAIAVPMLFPVLMWMASLAVLYFAIFHLVIRHIRTLNRQMRRFALGHRETEAELPHSAPHELRELGGTFHKMTRIISRDEAAREAALAEKTVLLKEVHHRVKNNLQLIASILNLQMRQLQDSGARAVLQTVQDRVLGLATIHRSLYEEPQLSELRADRMLGDVLRQMLLVGVPPDSGIEVTRRLDPLCVDPAKVVPLTLLLTEALTNALKHIAPPENGNPPWLDVRLRALNGRAELSIANSTGAKKHERPIQPRPDTQLGNELIAAFALQLDAELERGCFTDARGRAYGLSIRFALQDDGATGSASATQGATREAIRDVTRDPMPPAREAPHTPT
jgi:two-component sensor histidine kinase